MQHFARHRLGVPYLHAAQTALAVALITQMYSLIFNRQRLHVPRSDARASPRQRRPCLAAPSGRARPAGSERPPAAAPAAAATTQSLPASS